MKGRELAYIETMFCWSPKLKQRVKLVGPQIYLQEIAESRPEIVSYSFPGPLLALDDQLPKVDHTVRMTATWKDGVTGALDFLSRAQAEQNLAPRISIRARDIGLRIEVFEASNLHKMERHYSSWRQLVRFLHPMLRPEGWGVTKTIQGEDWPRDRLSIADMCRITKSDKQAVLTATAFLIHAGYLTFDSDRGFFDLRSKVWRVL